eukprot:scaffold11015_cov95-Skeletonema_dohrnii-CCMP3373.AAC.1
MGLLWVDWSKLITGWPQRMPWLGCRGDFFEFFAIRNPTIHHYDDDLIDKACDSEDDLTHNAYNNLDVHANVIGIAYLSIGPSPTLHYSGSCARHRWTLLMLTTYLMK